jgi:small subunit ribosomal protein S6
MAKNKSSQKPTYELLYAIAQKFTEEETKPISEKIVKMIEKAEGTIKYTETWGKRKLAYAIKGYSFGYYTLLEFELDGVALAAIDRTLKIMPELIRHLIIKINPDKKPRSLKLPKIDKDKKEAPPVPAVLEKKVEAKKESTKVDLKDLDQKLDKLLEIDNLL